MGVYNYNIVFYYKERKNRIKEKKIKINKLFFILFFVSIILYGPNWEALLAKYFQGMVNNRVLTFEKWLEENRNR